MTDVEERVLTRDLLIVGVLHLVALPETLRAKKTPK
jgi:hypothetical protein